MIKKTAELINDKKIEGISDLRDESDRNGMRIVYEIKRDAIANVVLNKLYKYTSLQTTISVNNICLVDGRPKLLNLRDMIQHFVNFRHEVVIRRTQFELRKAEERAHILEGLIIASDNIDEVIEIIKSSSSPDAARERVAERFGLSEIQTRAIVDMRLRQLTGLEQDKLRAEYDDLVGRLREVEDLEKQQRWQLDMFNKQNEADKEMLKLQSQYNPQVIGTDSSGNDILGTWNINTNQYDPVQTTKTSVHGAINMLGLAKRTRARILQASTSEVYGDPAIHPQVESYWGNVNPIGTRSCYDEGKRCAETLFFDYSRQHGVPIKVIRIFNTYGPRMHPNDGRVVSNFIVQALAGRDITIFGSGDQTRSFCYVDDLVAGMMTMMASKAMMMRR
jgi:hypothetical protein